MTDFVKSFNRSRIQSLSVEEDEIGRCLSVVIQTPVSGFVNPGYIEEDFYIDETKNSKLKEAFDNFLDVLQESVRNGDNLKDVPCDTCSSPCCSHFIDHIDVTKEDVDRIVGAGHPKESFLETSGPGYGILNHIKMASGKKNCVFFDTKLKRCGIHEIKPQVCREYSGFYCDLYENASKRLIQLRVRADD